MRWVQETSITQMTVTVPGASTECVRYRGT